MFFLNFITDWISKAGDGVMGAILQAFRTLCYSLDTIIYKLIINAYDMFYILCNGRLLDDNLLGQIATRVGLILGIIMFLNVSFSVIQMVLDPDKLNDKDIGAAAIIKKVIFTIIMLGVSSSVFSTLYMVQIYVIDSNIISKVLLPYTVENKSKNGQNGLDKFGNVLSMELLTSFYSIENIDTKNDQNAQNTIATCESTLTALQNQIYNDSRFDLGYNCLNETVTVTLNNTTQETFVIFFNHITSIIVGAVVLYLVLMYCFKVGVRMIQLAFLEIISPMAIISYVSPKKDNMFSKWIKIYVATYIDVFIRMAIINFVVFLLAAMFSSEGLEGYTFWSSMGVTPGVANNSTVIFLKVIIIIALLTFAHKAPDLLKELLPASASKLGFGASMKDLVGLNKGVGAVTGAAGGLFGGAVMGAAAGGPIGFITGGIGGIFKGGAKGFSGKGPLDGIKSGFSAGKGGRTIKGSMFQRKQRMDEGGSSFVLPGAEARAHHYELEKEELEAQNKFTSSISGHVDEIKKRALSQINDGKFTDSEHITNRNAALQSIESLQERAKSLSLNSFDSYAMSELNKRKISPSDSNYEEEFERIRKEQFDAAQRSISSDIQNYQAIVNREEKEAINDFVMKKSDDAVVEQHIKQIKTEIKNAPSGIHLDGGTVNWIDEKNGLDRLGNSAKEHASNISIKLIENQKAGQKARANVKYNGKK